MLFTDAANNKDECLLCVFSVHLLPLESLTSLQVPTTHSEEINLKAKKGSWTVTPLAHTMINVDETGELSWDTNIAICLS